MKRWVSKLKPKWRCFKNFDFLLIHQFHKNEKKKMWKFLGQKGNTLLSFYYPLVPFLSLGFLSLFFFFRLFLVFFPKKWSEKTKKKKICLSTFYFTSILFSPSLIMNESIFYLSIQFYNNINQFFKIFIFWRKNNWMNCVLSRKNELFFFLLCVFQKKITPYLWNNFDSFLKWNKWDEMIFFFSNENFKVRSKSKLKKIRCVKKKE